MAEKQFKIKVGSVKRIKKDLEYYIQEKQQQQSKIDQMRADNKDEYDIKKQEEVLLETENMLPDCQSRLREIAEELKQFMSQHEAELPTFSDQELVKDARALLEAIPALL